MMYRLTAKYKHFTEEHQHDLWIMIRTLQNSSNPWDQKTGDDYLKKYFEPDVKEETSSETFNYLKSQLSRIDKTQPTVDIQVRDYQGNITKWVGIKNSEAILQFRQFLNELEQSK